MTGNTLTTPSPVQDDAWMLYGVAGWGSVLVEAMLAWCGVPCRLVDVAGFDRPGPARDALLSVNPLAQVPTAVLPNGEVITESAAIALLLSETFPTAGLAPFPGAPLRPAFLRRLLWLTSSLYPTFTFGDYPARWVATDGDAFKQRVAVYRQSLRSMFETELTDARWVLGGDFSSLDIFVGVMTRWTPGRPWIAAHCPRIHRIAASVDALERLQPVWRRNFDVKPG